MKNVCKRCSAGLTRIARYSVLASALLLTFPGITAQVFNPGPGTPVAGVNIHFTRGHEKDLDMIKAAGLKLIRTDMVWQDIEYARGKYNWEAYDELTENLEKRGLAALYILDYSNSLYEDTVSSKDPITGELIRDIAAPSKPASVKAFSAWAAEAAARYRGKNIIWEIWNEPNISFWRPAADIEKYKVLAMEVISSVRKADPAAVIIGPATSQIPFPFIESFLSSGVLNSLSAVSVHPYRSYSLPPESVAADYEKINELIKKYTPEGKKEIPVISSEWGYASCPGGLTVEKQAEYCVRMQLVNLLCGVPVSVWYDWKNDGESVTNFEHNCGTVSFSLEPKPAYTALATMNEQLGNMTLAHRITTTPADDYVLLFVSKKGIFRLAAWTTGEPHEIHIDAAMSHTSGISSVDGYGTPGSVTATGDGLTLSLTGLPRYITIPCGIRLN